MYFEAFCVQIVVLGHIRLPVGAPHSGPSCSSGRISQKGPDEEAMGMSSRGSPGEALNPAAQNNHGARVGAARRGH